MNLFYALISAYFEILSYVLYIHMKGEHVKTVSWSF